MTQTRSDTVNINLDGRAVEARPGEMIIAAAEREGVYIPRFCYHPRMRSVGMCRMCLVEVKGPRGYSLVPACFQAVGEGQEIRTESEAVRKAQNGVLEFLLLNHPLDCPVCDKGGECPLQDQTFSYGPGETRFIEEKRHWAKPIPLSALVDLDRERCIQCDRCTRFASEVAGEPLINFLGRGDHIEVNTYPDHPFASYFSGNTVQICPVGALTSSAYRFKSRPWDLEQVESTCTLCSVGCRTVLQATTGRLVRHLGVDVESVNHSWLCDKGRFGYQAANAAQRSVQPRARRNSEWEEITWSEALSEVAGKVSAALEASGPASIAVIGGARLANEDAYAWAKLAKGLLGTDSVDAQLGDGLPAELVCGLPRATIAEACQAKAVLLLGGDLREELPVLFLRLRGAALSGSTRLVEISSIETSLSSLSAFSLRYQPGGLGALIEGLVGSGPVGDPGVSGTREALGIGAASPGAGVVVVLGRGSLAEPAASMVAAAGALAEALPGARFLPALGRANLQGALDAGLAPGLLPGRVALRSGAEHYRSHGWEKLGDEPGRDSAAILAAAAAGEIEVLVLLGADPLSNFPDRTLAAAGLQGAGFVVSVETLPNASSAHAQVVLPASGPGERPGTTTNLEGRVSPLSQLVESPGQARPDWIIASELAEALVLDLGFACIEDIREEMSTVSPLHAGLLGASLGGEGVVLPFSSSSQSSGVAEIVIPLDPMATPGILPVETQGSPSLSGAATRVPEVPAEDQPPAASLPAMITWDHQAAGAPARRSKTEPAKTGEAKAAPANSEPGKAAPAKPSATRTAPANPGAAKGLALVLTRHLYDTGTMVSACASLAPLAPEATIRLNPADLAPLDLVSGDQVAVRTAKARLVVAATSDARVPRGMAVMGTNLAGADALALVDPAEQVAMVTLEKP